MSASSDTFVFVQGDSKGCCDVHDTCIYLLNSMKFFVFTLKITQI